MSADVEKLRNLYVELAGEETIVERQEGPKSRDPIDIVEDDVDAEVAKYLRNDGLDDAIAGAETE